MLTHLPYSLLLFVLGARPSGQLAQTVLIIRNNDTLYDDRGVLHHHHHHQARRVDEETRAFLFNLNNLGILLYLFSDYTFFDKNHFGTKKQCTYRDTPEATTEIYTKFQRESLKETKEKEKTHTKREIMKLSQLVLAPLVSARFDLGTIAEEPVENGLQCPPKDCLITFNFNCH